MKSIDDMKLTLSLRKHKSTVYPKSIAKQSISINNTAANSLTIDSSASLPHELLLVIAEYLGDPKDILWGLGRVNKNFYHAAITYSKSRNALTSRPYKETFYQYNLFRKQRAHVQTIKWLRNNGFGIVSYSSLLILMSLMMIGIILYLPKAMAVKEERILLNYFLNACCVLLVLEGSVLMAPLLMVALQSARFINCPSDNMINEVLASDPNYFVDVSTFRDIYNEP